MNKLKFIKEQMGIIAIPYAFGQWSSEEHNLYFVGEINESTTNTEDGLEQSTMLLTGFCRGDFADLLESMETIKSHFSPVHGLRGQTDSGSTIAVFFDGYFIIPNDGSGVKRIQINLKIYEWKGAI